MLLVCDLVFAVSFATQIMGNNIMLNKPTTQSSTYASEYGSSNANDGTNTGFFHTAHHLNLQYWQGDLQGVYLVHKISVTSVQSNDEAAHLQGALIGVSQHDVSCSEDEVTICGQWPDQVLPGHTIVYNCSHAGSVRFVRIWRDLDVDHALAIQEVEVEGEPTMLSGARYDKTLMSKYTAPTKSLSVSSVTDCGTICHRTQPCLAFSYSPSQQPNCLLATDVTMTSDVSWDSYKILQCSQILTCK